MTKFTTSVSEKCKKKRRILFTRVLFYRFFIVKTTMLKASVITLKSNCRKKSNFVCSVFDSNSNSSRAQLLSHSKPHDDLSLPFF